MKKNFPPHGIFEGTIKNWHKDTGWHIVYSDGDREDLDDWNDLSEILDPKIENIHTSEDNEDRKEHKRLKVRLFSAALITRVYRTCQHSGSSLMHPHFLTYFAEKVQAKRGQ